MRKRIGFTLIELLIVVAIIAILAAIAVPNFLEAQVRSKVSRVMNDERAIATALEAYRVDFNRGPLEFNEYYWLVLQPAGIPGEMRHLCYKQLTTPVAYMTGFLRDPFGEKRAIKDGRDLPEMAYYTYQAFYDPTYYGGACERCTANGYYWVLYSVGPSGRDVVAGLAEIWPETYLSLGCPKDRGAAYIYDATNGTSSFGRIHRTNKGVLTGSSL